MEIITSPPAERRRKWCNLNTCSCSLLNIISSQLPSCVLKWSCLTLHISGKEKGWLFIEKWGTPGVIHSYAKPHIFSYSLTELVIS